MIRYYGLYARHRDSDKALIKAINIEKHKVLKNLPNGAMPSSLLSAMIPCPDLSSLRKNDDLLFVEIQT